MVATQVPLGDLSFGEREAVYVAALEAKLTAMTLNEIRYRTLLEMLTGKQWEELRTDIMSDKMKSVAVNATQRRLAREMKRAEKSASQIVEENLEKANKKSTDEETA